MNAESRHPLFRQEVLSHRAERLHGDVSIAVPVPWQALGFLLLAALVTAAGFLATASYSRTETVGGAIVVDRGVAAIVPSRPGTVAALLVREGQRVAAGAVLARIRAEEDMNGGTSAPSRVMDALQAQDNRLASQSGLILSAAAAERSRLSAQAGGLAAEIASIDRQIAEQQRLVGLAENEMRAVKTVAERGFLSRRDLEARESTLIARRQQLSQLQQGRANRAAALSEAQRAMTQASAVALGQAAGVDSSRAALAQQLAQAEAAKGYALTAPVAGTVTTLTSRLGQAAAPGQALMAIIPEGGRLRAELQVPTSAAGFLAPGQIVRLSVDAFPYQRFGTVDARIAAVDSVPVARPQPGGGSVPVYLAAAELDRAGVAAFGRLQPLVPGMTLSARIVTRRRLFEWLFEPLFAVARR